MAVFTFVRSWWLNLCLTIGRLIIEDTLTRRVKHNLINMLEKASMISGLEVGNVIGGKRCYVCVDSLRSNKSVRLIRLLYCL